MPFKICPACGQSSYSACCGQIWICPCCGEDLSAVTGAAAQRPVVGLHARQQPRQEPRPTPAGPPLSLLPKRMAK